MDTIAKPEARSTDRLIQALSTLAVLLDRSIGEVKTLDAEFQNRILQAIHDTESSLQKRADEHLQRAVEESDQKIRMQVIEEMKTQAERQVAAAVESVRGKLTAECDRLNRELDHATKSAAQWESERTRLILACEQARQELLTAQDVHARQAAAARPSAPPVVTASQELLQKEIARIECLIRETSALIDDPATDLSTVIHKNVQKAELDSYLKGIRFAIDPA